jgi:site-specific recombinase XerD
VSARRLREFIYSLVDEHASEGRLVMHISALRTIFDRVCGLQLTDRIVGPKRARRLPEILNRTEAERLVRAGRTIRDQVLLGLLYGCGLTGSEAVRLRWGDVREGGLRLHVAASTRYMERILLVPEPLRELLAAGAATCAAEDYIFSGRKAGAHISTRAVEQLVRRACAAAQIERPVSVMTLRHAYAVHRLEAGAGVRRVQEELGHASIRTTERYRRCLTPRIENHPFTRVRELMTTRHGVEPVTFDAEVSRAHVIPPGFRPLSELRGIDPELMRLPFAPLAEENPVLTFMRLLKTRIVGALFPGTVPS